MSINDVKRMYPLTDSLKLANQTTKHRAREAEKKRRAEECVKLFKRNNAWRIMICRAIDKKVLEKMKRLGISQREDSIIMEVCNEMASDSSQNINMMSSCAEGYSIIHNGAIRLSRANFLKAIYDEYVAMKTAMSKQGNERDLEDE